MIVAQRKSSFFQNSLEQTYSFEKESFKQHVIASLYSSPVSKIEYAPEELLVKDIFEHSPDYGIMNDEKIDELYASIMKRRINYRQNNSGFKRRALLYDLFAVMSKKFINENRTDNLYRFTKVDSQKLESPIVLRNIIFNIITNKREDFSFCHLKLEQVHSRVDFLKEFKDVVLEENSGWLEYIGFKVTMLDKFSDVLKAMLADNLRLDFSQVSSDKGFYKLTSEVMKSMEDRLQDLNVTDLRLPNVVVAKSESFFRGYHKEQFLMKSDTGFGFVLPFFSNILERIAGSSRDGVLKFRHIDGHVFIERAQFQEFLDSFEEVFEYMVIMRETGDFINRSLLDMKKAGGNTSDLHHSTTNFTSLATASDVTEEDLNDIKDMFEMFRDGFKAFSVQIDNSMQPKRNSVRVMGDMLTIKTTATQIYNKYIRKEEHAIVRPNFDGAKSVSKIDLFADSDIFMSKVMGEQWLQFHLDEEMPEYSGELVYYVAESIYNFICIQGSSQLNLGVVNQLESSGILIIKDSLFEIDFNKLFKDHKQVFHPRIIEFLVEREFSNISKVIYIFRKMEISFPWHLIKPKYFNEQRVDQLFDVMREESSLFSFKDGIVSFDVFSFTNSIYMLKKEGVE